MPASQLAFHSWHRGVLAIPSSHSDPGCTKASSAYSVTIWDPRALLTLQEQQLEKLGSQHPKRICGRPFKRHNCGACSMPSPQGPLGLGPSCGTMRNHVHLSPHTHLAVTDTLFCCSVNFLHSLSLITQCHRLGTLYRGFLWPMVLVKWPHLMLVFLLVESWGGTGCQWQETEGTWEMEANWLLRQIHSGENPLAC
jgi:hypothetical protein